MSSNSVCNHTRNKQIGLPLRGHLILLSLVWLQTELDSTQSCYHYLSNRSFEGAANLDFLDRLFEKSIYASLTKHCPLCIVIIILIGQLLNWREGVSHKKIIIYFFLMFPDFLVLSAMRSLFQIWPALINVMNSCLFSLAPNSFKRKLQGKNNIFLLKNWLAYICCSNF